MFNAEEITNHIYNITGVPSYLLNAKTQEFIEEPSYCAKCNQCDYYGRHAHSASEAERWSNRYIYYCNIGLIFIATENKSSHQTLITGPIVMEEAEMEEEETIGECLRVFSTQAVGSISELIFNAYSLYEEDGNTISQSDILKSMYEVSEEMFDITLHLKYENEIESAIMIGDKERAKELINKLLGFIFLADSTSLDVIKSRVVEFIVLLSRAIMKSGAQSNHIFELNMQYMKEIEHIKTVDRLHVWLVDVIHTFVTHIQDMKSVKNKDIIFRIMAYIQENFMNKITLSDVATHVFLSNSYLSKLIREELGCSFTQYVNRIRIERSKELLRNSQVGLVEICNMVGFEDQSYFTKVFKKATGLSPRKYREQRL